MSDDDYKTDPEYGLSHRDLREAEMLLDAQEENAKLRAKVDTLTDMLEEIRHPLQEAQENNLTDTQAQLEKALAQRDQALGKIDTLTDMLEEILEYCQDNYDVDPDPSGGHDDIPNWYMKTGTAIEEVLGRGGRYGF